MRWCYAGVGMVVLMLMTGCPTEFGKDGRVNKAVRNDALELLREECDPKTFALWCDNDREHTPECIEKCG